MNVLCLWFSGSSVPLLPPSPHFITACPSSHSDTFCACRHPVFNILSYLTSWDYEQPDCSKILQWDDCKLCTVFKQQTTKSLSNLDIISLENWKKVLSHTLKCIVKSISIYKRVFFKIILRLQMVQYFFLYKRNSGSKGILNSVITRKWINRLRCENYVVK